MCRVLHHQTVPFIFFFITLFLSNIVGGSDDPSPKPSETLISKVSLKQAIQRALARNPSILIAQADVARAEALVQQARASSFPTLIGNLNFTKLDEDRIMGEGTPSQRTIAGANSVTANFVLSIPLFSPQRWVQWSHSKDTLESIKISSQDVQRLLAARVSQAFLATLAQHRLIEIIERARETAKAHLAFAKKKFAGGATTKIVEARMGQDVETTEAQLQNAHAGLARMCEALGVLLGEDGPIDVAGEEDLSSNLDIQEALNSLVKRRNDLQSLDSRVKAAKNLVHDSWTDFVPSLIGTFQPFYQNPASLTQPTTGWQAQLLLSLPFYDGGLRYGQQKERRSILSAAQATLEAGLRQARSEVRIAFKVMMQADKTLCAARNAARLGQDVYTMAGRAFEAGATNSLELIDAARHARDAETAAIIAEDNLKQAKLDLLIASGMFP